MTLELPTLVLTRSAMEGKLSLSIGSGMAGAKDFDNKYSSRLDTPSLPPGMSKQNRLFYI